MAEPMSFQNFRADRNETLPAVSVSPRGVEEPKAICELDVRVREAASVAERLESLQRQLPEQEEKLSRSTVHLQERLQVSAQVLKAFQSQINQVEDVIRRLQEHATIQQAELDMFEDKLDELCKAAIERFEKELNARVTEAAAKSHEPIADLAEEVRRRIEPEVERVSTAIRTVAMKVESLTGDRVINQPEKQHNGNTAVEVKDSSVHTREDVTQPPPLRLLSNGE